MCVCVCVCVYVHTHTHTHRVFHSLPNPHFFNNFTTNEDSAAKFEADLPNCVRNVTT